MNSLPYNEPKKEIEAPYIDLSFLAGEEWIGQGAVSTGFFGGATDSLPADSHDAARLISSTRAALEPSSAAANKALAAGILKQAGADVRRFRNATTSVEQELYMDAYSWIVANDFSWPFSFLNVCKALGLVPDIVRSDLLGDFPLGWFGYCRKVGARLTRALQSSFAFSGRRTLEGSKSNWAVPVSMWQ